IGLVNLDADTFAVIARQPNQRRLGIQSVPEIESISDQLAQEGVLAAPLRIRAEHQGLINPQWRLVFEVLQRGVRPLFAFALPACFRFETVQNVSLLLSREFLVTLEVVSEYRQGQQRTTPAQGQALLVGPLVVGSHIAKERGTDRKGEIAQAGDEEQTD